MMIRRRGALLVVHDPRQHVVYLGEFLVDEENALAAVGQQPGQLIFVKNVCHYLGLPFESTNAGRANSAANGNIARMRHPRFAAIE